MGTSVLMIYLRSCAKADDLHREDKASALLQKTILRALWTIKGPYRPHEKNSRRAVKSPTELEASPL
jgi:hypothetical protein